MGPIGKFQLDGGSKHYREMLRSGKQRSSANDTTLSNRELRKLEADSVVLEQKLETLREQHRKNARKI